jgi:hypothetical protein
MSAENPRSSAPLERELIFLMNMGVIVVVVRSLAGFARCGKFYIIPSDTRT